MDFILWYIFTGFIIWAIAVFVDYQQQWKIFKKNKNVLGIFIGFIFGLLAWPLIIWATFFYVQKKLGEE